MFGSIGVVEIVVLAGIALIVMGPEKFPDFAKIVARTIRDIRGYMNEAQQSLAEELKPMRKEFDRLSRLDADKVIDKWAGTDADGEKKAEKADYEPVKKPETDTAADDTGYNPEPEGPTLDGTFSYGSFSGKPEESTEHTATEEETAVNAEPQRYPAAGDAPLTDEPESAASHEVAQSADADEADTPQETVLPKTMERLDG